MTVTQIGARGNCFSHAPRIHPLNSYTVVCSLAGGDNLRALALISVAPAQYEIQSTLVISTSVISNNRLSRIENLVLV